ncbi:alpha/beta fold hydrolase [Merismopedia glauca]|uniref:alpha/beta fold hydrolase n=1 Tax=Merismopedia glauca TaxID=292586 RepID=UPI0015E77110|nr:alpha/beta hydrolase [Merismopedia glauca]
MNNSVAESQGKVKVKVNDLNLYYEAFGNPSDPPVLLINGLSCQCLQWFPYFYEPIVDSGYYVIRFDNRDVGLSTWIKDKDWEKQPYSLVDMAKDAVGLLEALGIANAHLIGVSMGGAIAQRIAIDYPDRILSLTSIVSFAEASAVGMEGIASFLSAKVPSIEEYLAFWSLLVGTTFPLDVPLYAELYRESVEVRQGYNPDCIPRQLRAIASSSSTLPELKKIDVPTLILYGTADPLIPVAHAVEYAKLIPASQQVKMEDVGVKAVFTKFMGYLTRQNFSRSELHEDTLTQKMLADNIAIVSGVATRFKKDEAGKEVVLEKIGVTYTLHKDKDNQWKIITGVNHKPETAIAL